MAKGKKTTVNLQEPTREMLKEMEERWGITQTAAIQFGIVLAHKFFFTKEEETKRGQGAIYIQGEKEPRGILRRRMNGDVILMDKEPRSN